MKRETIRAEMSEDVIQEELLLRKVMCFHAVSTQSVIEDVSHHGVQLCVRVIAVLMPALFQDVLQSKTGLKTHKHKTDVALSVKRLSFVSLHWVLRGLLSFSMTEVK